MMKGKEVATSIWKRPVARIAVDSLGFVGETRIAKPMCAPEDHAVYFYPFEHYATWQAELGCAPFELGQFGENLTCVGLMEHDVRLGDVLRCGGITVQVTQPRLPCAKLDARMGQRFAGRFLRSLRLGFLARVLEPGEVGVGDAVEVVERDPAEPTVHELARLTQVDAWDGEGLAALARSRWLPAAWRELIEHKAELAREAQGWHGLRPLEVVERREHGAEAVSLWLACPRGKPLAPFVPGQYLTVAWRQAHDESALRRPYAITSAPEDLVRYRITVQRVAGGPREHGDDDEVEGATAARRPPGVVSTALREQVRVGDKLLVAAPRGHTTLAAVAPTSRGLLVLSEGIGLATALPLLRQWRRTLPAVPAVHVHLAQRPGEVALLDELRSLDGPRLRRILALREPPGDDAGQELSGYVLSGELPVALLRELAARVDHVFIAGASSFSERTAAGLADCGAALHVERFGELGSR